jgi:orotate phosphoribosyltransferase
VTTIKPAVELAARAVVAARTEELFRASGAFREGHFELTSGRHADAYIEKFAVLADPAATSELVSYWVARLRGDAVADGGAGEARPPVDLVAGPTTGGVVLAFEAARQLGTLGIFAEEVHDADGASRREFRRGFSILPGERVLLVDDILTTGGSLLSMIPAVEALGGEIVECAVLVDRSGGRATLTSPTTGRTYPLRALWQLDLPSYEPGEANCPRCAAGDPLDIPGSTGTTAGEPPGG